MNVPRRGFGAVVREARRRAGLTLQDLAESVGCAKSYLSAIETGQRPPPGADVVAGLERALGAAAGSLQRQADLERALRAGGEPLRQELSRLDAGESTLRRLRAVFRGQAGAGTLDTLRRIVEAADATGEKSGVLSVPIPLNFEIPLINKVSAGYPSDFTDLAYPARVADEYVRAPDLNDPDAFAARVCGDSMRPEYTEGDIVIFSPSTPVRSGMDCFVRLEPDHQTTFKRVYFEQAEGGEARVRLQPLNPAYAPRSYAREQVAGLYAAVSVMRRVGAGSQR